MSIEWSGEFENQLRARRTLSIIFPMVAALILLLLYITFKDLLDTSLVFLAVLGALAGAVMFQAIFGFNFSVIVSIGYVAAFGMATQTGVIMLVYLREALDRRGGLGDIGLARGAEASGDRRGGAPPAAEAAHRGRGDHRAGADAVGDGNRRRKSCARWPPRCSAGC
jgi:hypothetical protein